MIDLVTLIAIRTGLQFQSWKHLRTPPESSLTANKLPLIVTIMIEITNLQNGSRYDVSTGRYSSKNPTLLERIGLSLS